MNSDNGKKAMYTEEEKEISKTVCDIVNADDELKHLFVEATFKILTDFAVDENKAHRAMNVEEGQRIMQHAVDMFKSLTMCMCTKVISKMEDGEYET